MKSLLSFVFALSFTLNSMSQTNTDWKSEKLKGKVKSFVLLENYRYKKAGKFTDWAILYNKKYTFNNAGRYTEYTELKANGDLSYKIKYTYNTKEKKASVNYIDKEEKTYSRKEWLYNSKGQLTEIQEYTKENQLHWRYVYTYDAKGNRAVLESYRPDNTLYSKTTWTYDEKGNETGYLLVTPGYANSGRKLTYDAKGNMIEELWLNGKNAIDFRFLRTYDNNGNVTEELKYRGQDKLLDKTTWKFEYDSKGNWIKKTQYTSDGIDFDIAERTITYF